MLSPRASVSNPAEKSYSQDMLSVKPMVMCALEPHMLCDQFLLRGVLGSNKSKHHSANPPVSLLTEWINAEVSNSMKKAKAHIYPLSTLTARNPPAQPFFYTGASCTRQQSSANCLQKTEQTKINTRRHEVNLTELKAELGRCCHICFITVWLLSHPLWKDLANSSQRGRGIACLVCSISSCSSHFRKSKTKSKLQTSEAARILNCTFYLNGYNLNHETEEWRKAQLF